MGLWRRRKVPSSDPDFFSLLTANVDLLIKTLKGRCDWMAVLPKEVFIDAFGEIFIRFSSCYCYQLVPNNISAAQLQKSWLNHCVWLDLEAAECRNGSRDWTVAVVFDALQGTWRSDVLAEVVGGVCRQSEVAIDQWHEGERLLQALELHVLPSKTEL